MFFELAKPAALLLCLLSLYAVFHTAFLVPAIDLQDRIDDSLLLLLVAAGISVTSGLLFRDAAPAASSSTTLIATLPMKIFCWAAAAILVLFAVSWYLETYCIFYRDIFA
jgi:hypothetical protein